MPHPVTLAGLHPVPRYGLTVERTAPMGAGPEVEESAMSFDVPDACTLPTIDRPLRLAEFDDLFASAVREVEVLAPTHARMRLVGGDGLADRVQDLAVRETACCSFFDFTVTPVPDDGTVVLDIEVPPAHAEVLASLAERARAVSDRG